MRVILSLLFFSCFGFASCNKDISPGDDPNFIIVENNDEGFSGFNRKVVVFQIPIYAKKKVEDSRLLHAANIMAQYLDNNACMVMWNNMSDLLFMSPPGNVLVQDLGNDETIAEWHTNGMIGRFDAALEEVLHIITHAGYAYAYPEVFGEEEGTELCNAMDIARGGQFVDIPDEYPEEAWYHYDDATCEYNCMATEYIYWALTSLLGAQIIRSDEINHEWELHTPELLEDHDTAIYELLINEEYKFPAVLPDGTYLH